MAGSEYYDDFYCRHGNNVGYYGTGCAQCDQDQKDRKDRYDYAYRFHSQGTDFLKTIPRKDWDKVKVSFYI